MKHMRHWLIMAALLLCSTAMVANNFEKDGIHYNITSETELTLEVTSYNNSSGMYTDNVEIPSTVIYESKEYMVTSIGDYAFYYCSSLSSITIPESVTSIGSHAFSGCSGELAVNCNIPSSSSYSSGAFYNSSFSKVTIGNNVTSIGDYAFYNCSYLTSISIPESVTSIGKSAFYNCSSLTSITIPESVTSIGSYAFSGCSSLTSITIPESVTSIGSHAFSGCSGELAVNCNIPSSSSYSSGAFYNSSFSKVTIGNNVTSIGDYAFYNCSYLTSISIPESVTSIGKSAFYNCSSLTSITIPESVTSIGSYAFSGCTGELAVNCNIPSSSSYSSGAFYNSSFSKVTIGNNVTSIGDYAFYSSYNLGIVVLSKNMSSIGKNAFWGCNDLHTIINHSNLPLSVGGDDYGYIAYYAELVLQDENLVSIGDFIFSDGTLCAYLGNDTTIELPKDYNEGIYAIGNRVFYNHTDLASITIPNGVTSIGNYAFYGCNKLTAMAVPESVTSIGDYAFYFCSSIASITIPQSVTSIGSYAFSGCTGEATVNCNIPSASSSYNGVFYGSDFSKITVGNNVNVIGNYAFCDCNKLTMANLPENLKSIGDYSFRNCSNLSSITIPQGVTSIGNYAFYGCSSLTSLEIPEGVTSISDYTFNGCKKLSSITIPQGVTSIGNYAFYGCSSLTEISLPGNVASIGSYAFYDCNSLTSMEIPEGITNISDYTFNGCSNLSSTTIPQGVTSIGNYAFNGCSSLTGISIPKSVTSMGSGAFYNCSSLTSMEIPKGITNISDYTFNGCSNLSSITIPQGVTNIGNSAFEGCNSLTSIEIPEGVTSISHSAFHGCEKLSSITIPQGVTNIGNYAFYGCSSLTEISIPESVTSIGSYAFSYCSSLMSAAIPDKVTRLRQYVFYNCPALTTLTIGTEVETIDSYFLNNCNLNALLCYATIPPSIQTYSFYQSTISAIYVPEVSVALYKAADVWKDYNILAISDYTANLLTVSYEYGVGVTTVTLDASLDNSRIYYTLDGSDPLETGVLYDNPFEVSSACTLKAIAVCAGFENSNLIDERIVIKNNPTLSNFSFSYDEDITYDGISHKVYVYASNGMGEITVIYKDANGVVSTEAPSAVGKYDVSIDVAEGSLYYAASFDNVVSFTISIMDDVEWETLQELYVQTNGDNQWNYKWDIDGGIAAAASFYGVTYKNGHIIELNLSNRNLVGELPVSVLTLPYLERLILSRNKLSGNLGSIIAGAATTGNVNYININDNNLTGNIGTIATCCPNLEYLYAARNHFSDVSPALPQNLHVYLSEQTIDDILIWDSAISSENTERSIPTILVYDHTEQNYDYAEWMLNTVWKNGNRWSIEMNMDIVNGTSDLSAQAENYIYYGNSGDTLDVTTSTAMTAHDSKAKMIYRFKQGDANLSGDVNVLDVQSTINFVFKVFQYYPFNHTAANMQSADANINVLDVIALINQLIAENISEESQARARAKNNMAAVGEASLYWEGNHLILETEKDIAALDIVLQSTEDLQWREDLGMIMTSSAQNGYQRAISYSLSGKYIPQGKHILITTTPCQIASALIADRAAQKVSVSLKSPETTELEEINSSDIQCYLQNGCLQLITDATYNQLTWEVYEMNGGLLAKGELLKVAEGVTNLIAVDGKKTVVVIIKDDKGLVLTQKINTIK